MPPTTYPGGPGAPLGLLLLGSGFCVLDFLVLGCWFLAFSFGVWASEFGFPVPGLGFRVMGFSVYGFGFLIFSFEFRV